jgi:hypothetical protein
VVEGCVFLSFEVRRVIFVWDRSGAIARAVNAVPAQERLAAMKRAVPVDLENAEEGVTARLPQPDQASCVHAGVWLRLRDFSREALALAAAPHKHVDTSRFDNPRPGLLDARSFPRRPGPGAANPVFP